MGVAATALAGLPQAGAAVSQTATGAVQWGSDRIEVQLAPAAARTAWRTRLSSNSGPATQSSAKLLTGASLSTDVALRSLGLASLDRALASYGEVTLEPEFRGELPPAPGSDATDFTAFYIARWSGAVPVEQIAARLRALPEVASADPIPLLPVAVTPNDSLFASSYWFQSLPDRHDIAAPEAWDVTVGDTAIVVGVLDTGVLPYHPDLGGSVAGLHGQMWRNAAEVVGVAGVDDDGNGFIDDVSGWDFINRPPDGVATGEDYADQDPDANDMAGHGTAVAGVIGALTNNSIGVSGTAWNVRLMPLRIGWSATGAPLGLVDMSAVAQALRYAARMQVPVVNCSFATLNLSGLYAAAASATRAGVVIVSAAGNGGQPHDLANREDVIAVAATGPGDVVANFSNLGSFVDIAAPGAQIATTFVRPTDTDSIGLRQPSYVVIDGTSFSAPLVAGGAALIQAQRRWNGQRLLSPQGMLLRLVETTDDISAQNTGVTGYGAGRLDLERALTDRPTSTAARAGAITIGSALLMASGVEPGVAYLAQNQRLMIKAGQVEDTISVHTLPGSPIGSPAGSYSGFEPFDPGDPFAMFAPTGNGRIAGFDRFGAALPGWPVVAGGPLAPPTGGPALGDLDGDGSLEVVCGLAFGDLYAWHADGSVVASFPLVTSASGVSVPVAIADLDGDGDDEIVAAAAEGDVHVFRGDGTEPSGWPQMVAVDPQAPVVTRFSRDESPVIVVAAGTEVTAFRTDGTPRFSLTLPAAVVQAPALGDLDGDGIDEVVLALATPAIAVVDSSGAMVGGAPFPLSTFPNGPPMIGPITPGGREIVIFEGNDLAAFGIDGSRRGPFPKPGHAGSAATLADLDGDGATEIAAGTAVDSILYVYDAGPSSWSETWIDRAWLTHRGDGHRTGSRDVGPPSRVVDLAAASVEDSSITLRWTSPANEDQSSRRVTFEIHANVDSISIGGFAAAAMVDTVTLITASGRVLSHEFRGLVPNVRYAFALRATDAAGNVSTISNIASATTSLGGPLANHVGPGIAPARRPSGRTVELFWRGAGASSQHITIYDVLGRRVRRLPVPAAPEGVTTWDGRDDDGLQVSAGVYFVRLTSGPTNVQTRVVLIP